MKRFVPLVVSIVLVLAVAAVGAALRLGWLGRRLWPTDEALSASGERRWPMTDLLARPMHTDEAVQAAKFGQLLDTGVYRYDPVEYHGPTLYYLTLPAAWLAGAEDYVRTDETMYRMVPLVFGVGLIVLLVVVTDGLGPGACVWAALLTAASHAMVFYSRYYVQEMLLVFFTFGAIAFGWRYARSRRLVWAILCGAFGGLMHATKETAIIAFFALVVALNVTLIWRGLTRGRRPGTRRRRVRWWHLAAAVMAGAIVSVVFYTSFFTHLDGPIDSLRAYFSYFNKAQSNQIHNHPWDYYLQMLLYWKDEPMRSCPAWSEALIVALAAVGLVAGLSGKGLGRASVWLVRFLGVYTVVLTAVYSTIGYKTPWCMLGFLHGMILLGGVGAMALLRMVPLDRVGSGLGAAADLAGALLARLALVVLLAGACYGLGVQARRGCARYPADPRNPYVYGHSLPDVVRLCRRVEELAALHPDGPAMPVQVVAPRYWPVPWYLRRMPNVGYYNAPPPQLIAPVVLVGQPDEDDPDSTYGLEEKLWRTYEMEFYGLRVRPSVFLRLFVHRELWDKFIETRSKIRIPPPPRGK